MNLFKRAHKHTWKVSTLINKEYNLTFTKRFCTTCGEFEVKNRWGNKWTPIRDCFNGLIGEWEFHRFCESVELEMPNERVDTKK